MIEPEDNLDEALREFDRVASNLKKLQNVWDQIERQAPAGIQFGTATSEVDDLHRAFEDLASGLPSIDGFTIVARPWNFDEMAQARMDAQEVGFPEAITSVERDIETAGRELAEYRYRLNRARRSMARRHVEHTVATIDALLQDVRAYDGIGEWEEHPRWDELTDLVSRLDRLVGNTVPGQARWQELRRHLRFAQENDLSDIKTIDWPSVRAEVETNLYDDHEAVPITVDDIGALARAQPTGSVTTRLQWERLSDEQFEAVVFDLIRSAPGYENTNLLMSTHAPDRGRDIETYRVVADPLSGTRRLRVIVQCKLGVNRSVGRNEMVQCLEAVKLWEPPPVDVLVIATSGRFSQDAVAKAEKQTDERAVPAIEMWPDSHLETLLSRRPDLTGRYALR